MKIKVGNKVYLQNYEADYIMRDVVGSPMSINQESSIESGTFFTDGPVEGLRFGSIYKDPDNVSWIMAQDWIIDYEEYAKKSLQELEYLYECLKVECVSGIEEFNARDEVYRDLHYDEESEKFSRLSHKIASIGLLIGVHKGKTNFILPSCYKGATIPGTTRAISAPNPKKKSPFFHFKRGAH